MPPVVATSHTLFLVAAALLMSSPAQAVSQVLQVRGRLFNATGIPSTGSKDMTLSVYSSATGGAALWTSAVQTVSIGSDGGFSFLVDAATGSPSLVRVLATLASSVGAWFEFTVDSGTANGVMNTPKVVASRTRASGTAFALTSASTDGLARQSVTTSTPTSSQILLWNGSAWVPSDPPGKQSGLSTEASRRTTSTMNLYVRTDGNDTTCTGFANASSASAPACAFASPQKAVDVVPDIVLHSVTINVQAGTYRAASAGAILMSVGKTIHPNANFIVRGSGAVIFSGATSGAPTTAVGDYGVEVRAPSNGLSLADLTLSYFKKAAILVRPAADLSIAGVTASSNTGHGIHALGRSALKLSGANAFLQNSSSGILIQGSWLSMNGGTLNLNSNSAYGISASQSFVELSGGTVNINSNGSYGFMSTSRSHTSSTAVITANSNGASGIYARNAHYVLSGTLTANSNSYIGIEASGSSSAQFDGNVTLNSNGLTGASGYSHGQIYFNKGLSSTMSTAGWFDSLIADQQGGIYFNNNGSDAITLTGNASNVHRAMRSTGNSLIAKTGSGSVTITNYVYQGIWIHSRGVFIDNGSGSRSVSGITYSDTAYAEQMGLYRRGQFAVGNCAAGSLSRCN